MPHFSHAATLNMISKFSLGREMQDNSWYIKYNGGKMWTILSSGGGTFLYPFPPPTLQQEWKKMHSLSGVDSSQETYSHGSFNMNLCHAKVFSSPAPGTEHALLYVLWAKQLRWVAELLLFGNTKRKQTSAYGPVHLELLVYVLAACGNPPWHHPLVYEGLF